ncbi:Hypothetical_protein [Hexamita inflata]|uniref:Hypothetical_protein n=1 Tax=Hexamita inflata TaxID=28002 RepID=A0AA86QEM8_9EUKA|nr:Hypothetical protein HINF_LOCUS39264 [Hexamita inflata]
MQDNNIYYIPYHQLSHSFTNWCFVSSSAVARLSWSFTKHFLMKSLATSGIPSGYENFTAAMFAFVVSRVSWQKGGCPAISSQHITPRLQMSQPEWYGCPRTSCGGKQSSVPHCVLRLDWLNTDF